MGSLGRTSTEWDRDDARLVLDVVDRLRRSDPVPVVIATTDSSLIPATFETDDVDVRVLDSGWFELEDVQPSDLLVLPVHAVGGSPGQRTWWTGRPFADINVVVVGGPHRLSVLPGLGRRPLSGAVTSPPLAAHGAA